MAAGTFTLFSKNKDDIRINDITGATVKLALVSSSWTPNNTTAGNSVWADVSANEVSGGGWASGGQTMSSVTATALAGTNGYKLSTADVAVTASGTSIPAHRYAVMYVSGTLWGMTNPLIGYAVGDSTPADIAATTVGNTLTWACPANGWFDIS